MLSLNYSRRSFLHTSAGAVSTVAGSSLFATGASAKPGYLQRRLHKTLKIGMVKVEGSLEDKFNAVKAAGFEGIELNAPAMNVGETRRAIRETGLPVDGTVNSSHWNVRHSDPDPAVRAEALKSLKNAIRMTHAVRGHTVLLVVGHGKDGTEEEVWERSTENIAKALPLAAKLGIHIAIENVWNHFLYDHENVGDRTQTAEKFVRYVDQFNSPWVGMQFDIGNHWKYGSMGDWIRQLGHRIVKLDLKGFSRTDDKFRKIGEGDVDWADVRKALQEIRYTGWAAAEVDGGNEQRLQEISDNMDKAFGLV